MEKVYLVNYSDKIMSDRQFDVNRVVKAFNTKEKAIEYINEMYVKEKKYLESEYSDIIEWQDKLPIMESFDFECEEDRYIEYWITEIEVE